MYKLIYCLNPVNEMHLSKVMRDMLSYNEGPTFKAIDMDGYYVALEATHRIEAARRLGYAVTPIPVHRDEIIRSDKVEGLEIGSKPWTGKRLALAIVRNRFRFLTPIYKYNPESGFVDLKYYPVLDTATVAKIVFYTSVFWVGLAATISVTLYVGTLLN